MQLFFDDQFGEHVQEVVEGDEAVVLPFMALMETHYVLLRMLPPAQVQRVLFTLRAWPVEIPESDPSWGAKAAEVKSRGGLSLGDAWNAACALQRDAILVHKDPEFDGLVGLKALHLGRKKR